MPGLLRAAVALVMLTAAAEAASVKAGALQLSGFWTVATPPGAPTASGYLTITNTGPAPDRLVEVTSPVAAGAMLHEMEVANGVATMRMVAGIDIPPGKTVTLGPNGFHIMFVTLKQALKTGENLPLVLTFAKAGTIEAALPVLPLGSRGPAAP